MHRTLELVNILDRAFDLRWIGWIPGCLKENNPASVFLILASSPNDDEMIRLACFFRHPFHDAGYFFPSCALRPPQLRAAVNRTDNWFLRIRIDKFNVRVRKALYRVCACVELCGGICYNQAIQVLGVSHPTGAAW